MKIGLGQLRKLLREAIEDKNRIDQIIEQIVHQVDLACKGWWQELSARILRGQIQFATRRPNEGQLRHNGEVRATLDVLYSRCTDQAFAVLESEDIDPDTIFDEDHPVTELIDTVNKEYWTNIVNLIRDVYVHPTDVDEDTVMPTTPLDESIPSGLNAVAGSPHFWSSFARRLATSYPDLDTSSVYGERQITVDNLVEEIRMWCRDTVEQIVTSSVIDGTMGLPSQGQLLSQFLTHFLPDDVNREGIRTELYDLFNNKNYAISLVEQCVVQTAALMYKGGELSRWRKGTRGERRAGRGVPIDWLYDVYFRKDRTSMFSLVGADTNVEENLEKNLELLASVVTRYMGGDNGIN